MTEQANTAIGRRKSVKRISGVYALIDPRDGGIKYIGQSVDINKRYKEHCRCLKKYPVYRWVNELKSLALKPDLIVMQEHEPPIDIEKSWIDRAKQRGINLFNLHEGGANISKIKVDYEELIWRVEGMVSPFVMLRRKLFPITKTCEPVRKALGLFTKERKSLKTQSDILNFELKMASIAHNFGLKDLADNIELWLVKVERKVNQKYPNRIQLIYNDGKTN